MRTKLLPLAACLFLATAVLISPTLAQTTTFETLKPGEYTEYEHEIPINLVFIGYDYRKNNRRDVVPDIRRMQRELPTSYTPEVRFPRFYGLEGRDMGLKYTFDYHVLQTDDAFEDRFFGYLDEIGEEGPPTLFQQCYSGNAPAAPDGTPNPCNQTRNVREITETLYIDAPSVEQWLTENTADLLPAGSDNAYTIYLINWYTRLDFKDHVYIKTDEPDPDTGYNFGELRQTRRLIAWGGETSRSWFYDLSAGPESWTSNYVVDVKDLDGDKVEDYRMPPIWEYSPRGYRPIPHISRDLGLVTRYVAINLLFTTSPLYDPLVTAPGPGGSKVVHVEVLQDEPGVDAREFVNAEFIREKMEDFQPYYDWQVAVEETNPIDPGAQRAFRIFGGLIEPTSLDCASQPPFDAGGSYFGALYCYFNENVGKYVPAYGPRDYVGEVFAINSLDETLGNTPLGFADDNWINGRQTYIFAFDSPFLREIGYGLTTTTVHEFGHNIGMSHPHDGYDSETGVDYGPEGEFLYVYVGTQSNTIMAYIDLNWDFGQFDKDNMYRWETAGYINLANELLPAILESPDVGEVQALLAEADAAAAAAEENFAQWNYLEAATQARAAYEAVVNASNAVGIPVGTFETVAAPNSDAALPLKDQPRPFVDQ